MSGERVNARDVMQQDVVALRVDMSLMEAYTILSEHLIGGAPVLDDEQRVVGVLSQTDLLKGSYKTEFDEFPADVFYAGMPFAKSPGFHELPEQLRLTPISEVMSKKVVSASPGDSVESLARVMTEQRIHRLIILDGNSLCGIVTSFDLLQLLAGQ